MQRVGGQAIRGCLQILSKDRLVAIRTLSDLGGRGIDEEGDANDRHRR